MRVESSFGLHFSLSSCTINITKPLYQFNFFFFDFCTKPNSFMKPFIDSPLPKALLNESGRRYVQNQKKKGKMLSKLLFTCEVFLSLQHYLPPLLTFQARGRLCIIVAAVSLSLWGIQWQSLLARETGCLHYWLGHAVLTEIAEDILGWLACVKLACFLSITSGESLLLLRVLDITSQVVLSGCQSITCCCWLKTLS